MKIRRILFVLTFFSLTFLSLCFFGLCFFGLGFFSLGFFIPAAIGSRLPAKTSSYAGFTKQNITLYLGQLLRIHTRNRLHRFTICRHRSWSNHDVGSKYFAHNIHNHLRHFLTVVRRSRTHSERKSMLAHWLVKSKHQTLTARLRITKLHCWHVLSRYVFARIFRKLCYYSIPHFVNTTCRLNRLNRLSRFRRTFRYVMLRKLLCRNLRNRCRRIRYYWGRWLSTASSLVALRANKMTSSSSRRACLLIFSMIMLSRLATNKTIATNCNFSFSVSEKSSHQNFQIHARRRSDSHAT